jgi:spermidine synthase
MVNKKISLEYLLLFSVFVIATCGLIYELVAGALASYLMGDSVKQFSFIIGVYLFAMGIGSYLSKFIEGNLISKFIEIEILVGLLGGISSTVLFWLFNTTGIFEVALYLFVSSIGIASSSSFIVEYVSLLILF